MNEIMYKVVCFNPINPGEAVIFLEKMQDKGWELLSVNGSYFYFRRGRTG